MTSSAAVDWKILVIEDVQSQNIRCHELKAGDQLHELLEHFQSFYTKAVVLINTQENYTLAPEFHEALSKSALPVLVLLKSDGEALLHVLDNYDCDGVYAKVDAENTVDAIPVQVDPSVDTSLTKKQKKRSGSEGQKEHGPGMCACLYVCAHVRIRASDQAHECPLFPIEFHFSLKDLDKKQKHFLALKNHLLMT